MAPPSSLPHAIERQTSDLLQDAMNLHSRTTSTAANPSNLWPAARCPEALERRDLSKGGIAGVSIGSVVGLSIVFFITYPFVARGVRLGWSRWKAKRKASKDDHHQAPSKSESDRDVEQTRPDTTSLSLAQQDQCPSLERRESHEISSNSSSQHESEDRPALETRALSDCSNPHDPHPDGDIGNEPPEYIHFTTGLSSTYYSSAVPNSAFGLSNDAEMQDPEEFQKAQERASGDQPNRKSSTLISTIRKFAQGFSGSTSDASVTTSASRGLDGNGIMNRNMTESPTNIGADSAIGDRGFVLPPDAVQREHVPAADANVALAPATASATINPMEIMGMGTLTENEHTWRFTHDLAADPERSADQEAVKALIDAAYVNGISLDLGEQSPGMGAVAMNGPYTDADFSGNASKDAYAALNHSVSAHTVTEGYTGSLHQTAAKPTFGIPSITGNAAVHGIVHPAASQAPVPCHTPLNFSHRPAGGEVPVSLPVGGDFTVVSEQPHDVVAAASRITPSSMNAFPSPISMTTATSQDEFSRDPLHTNSLTAQLQPDFNTFTHIPALPNSSSPPQQLHPELHSQQTLLQLQSQQHPQQQQPLPLLQPQQANASLDSSSISEHTVNQSLLSVPGQPQSWSQQQQQALPLSSGPPTPNINSNNTGFLPSPPQATENQLMNASYASFYPQPQAYENTDSYSTFIDINNSMIPGDMVYQPRMNTEYDHTQQLMAANMSNMPMNAMTADFDLGEYLPPQPSQYGHRYTLSNTSAEYGADVSDMSTPYPFNSPSGPSVANTPDTRISITPSPKVNLMHDMTSPYAAMHQSSPIASLKCDECGRTFSQAHKLNHHKRYHERPHECLHEGCGKRFGTKTHLERHVNDKHKQTRRYHCTEPGCPYSRAGGKGFPRKDNWRRHMLNIHNCSPGAEIQADVIDESMMNTGA
ncbi:hypothetical protein BROUX41_003098 [Berkeleyomyces rouxiae]|uniref:uncharacterized protein n=1 Tax=Berkeleyomyces rouxiae TaxID=2035830 RepID=UPI003B784764